MSSLSDVHIFNQAKFGSNLRRLRLKGDLSQNDLATLCDLEKTTISRIERGKTNVTLKTIVILSSALSCKPNELIRGIRLTPDM